MKSSQTLKAAVVQELTPEDYRRRLQGLLDEIGPELTPEHVLTTLGVFLPSDVEEDGDELDDLIPTE
jgi:hypothetical protein